MSQERTNQMANTSNTSHMQYKKVLSEKESGDSNWTVRHVVYVVLMTEVIIWDIMLCSLLNVNQRFRGTYCLHLQGWISGARLPPAFTLVYCLAYSSTLNIAVICSSKMSSNFQQTTHHYISADSSLQLYTHSALRNSYIKSQCPQDINIPRACHCQLVMKTMKPSLESP
jgi:hypothetical protein